VCEWFTGYLSIFETSAFVVTTSVIAPYFLFQWRSATLEILLILFSYVWTRLLWLNRHVVNHVSMSVSCSICCCVFIARGTWLRTCWNGTWSTCLPDDLQVVFGAIHRCVEDGQCWWCGCRNLPKHREDGWELHGTDTLVCWPYSVTDAVCHMFCMMKKLYCVPTTVN